MIIKRYFIILITSLIFSNSVFASEFFDKKNRIMLGFNVKGSKFGIKQVDEIDNYLSKWVLLGNDASKLVFRINGGTLSQKTYPKKDSKKRREKDYYWNDAQIKRWIKLQKKYKIKYIFTINFNDTAKSQRIFFDHWTNMGAVFSYIEMGNEFYLQKYRKSCLFYHEITRYDKSSLCKKEVTERTRSITAKKYMQIMVPEFLNEFKNIKLPFFLVVAPEYKDNTETNNYRKKWNNIVLGYLNDSNYYPEYDLNLALHIYKTRFFVNYNQINKLRLSAPNGTRIAITESGVLNQGKILSIYNSRRATQGPSFTPYKVQGEIEVNHMKLIHNQLIPGDIMLNQVLYTNKGEKSSYSKGIDLYSNIGPTGVTTKGKIIFNFFATLTDTNK